LPWSIGLRQVGRDDRGAAAGRAHRRRDLLELLSPSADERHGHPLLGQQQRRVGADTGAGARDHRHASVVHGAVSGDSLGVRCTTS
jgi:hypothetical protein